MIDVELEPEETTLVMRALFFLWERDDLDETEQQTVTSVSLKLGAAMGNHLLGEAVSAADLAREELEAVVNRQLTRAWKFGLNFSPASGRERPADAILDAAEAYAAAVAAGLRDEHAAGRPARVRSTR